MQKLKQIKSKILAGILALAIVFSLTACGNEIILNYSTSSNSSSTISNSSEDISLENIPEYSGSPYVVVNNNIPYFSNDELTTTPFEIYSDLDSLGRCGPAYANICLDLMPTEDRESISDVTPSGWVNKSYDFVDGKYLYNRCHLIGFQLAGENANEKNLITGTRYMNVDGMLPFENMVADYVKETENHVLYRVTPIFEENNLVVSGVLIEAESVEDNGEGVLFCVYCYNVQPGVVINYATGDNTAAENTDASVSDPSSVTSDSTASQTVTAQHYVLNTNSKKFHYPDCSGANNMNQNNRQDITKT